MLKNLRMPNTFVLLFSLLVMIAIATWFVPGGKYDTHVVDGKTLIDPASFQFFRHQRGSWYDTRHCT